KSLTGSRPFPSRTGWRSHTGGSKASCRRKSGLLLQPALLSFIMSTIRRVNILGVGVHPITMQEALSQVDSVIALHQKGYICATGVHGIMEAQRDAGLKDILNRSL